MGKELWVQEVMSSITRFIDLDFKKEKKSGQVNSFQK